MNSRSFSAGRVRRESRQPVHVTPNATKFFCDMLDSKKALGEEDGVAVQLGYRQSVSSPAMVYTFDFLDNSDIFACKARRPPDEYIELDKESRFFICGKSFISLRREVKIAMHQIAICSHLIMSIHKESEKILFV